MGVLELGGQESPETGQGEAGPGTFRGKTNQKSSSVLGNQWGLLGNSIGEDTVGLKANEDEESSGGG